MQGSITPYPGYRVVNILGLLRNLFRLPRVLGSLLSTLGEDNQLLKADRTSMEYHPPTRTPSDKLPKWE
jgi:hypothetical protein